jgi:hypothetical protein
MSRTDSEGSETSETGRCEVNTNAPSLQKNMDEAGKNNMEAR